MNISLGKVHWTELNLKLNWISSANVFAGLDIIRQILFLQKQILTNTRIILKETCQVPATIDIASIGQPANIKKWWRWCISCPTDSSSHPSPFIQTNSVPPELSLNHDKVKRGGYTFHICSQRWNTRFKMNIILSPPNCNEIANNHDIW